VDVYSPYSHDNRQQFCILYDHTFKVVGTQTSAIFPTCPNSVMTQHLRIPLRPLGKAPKQPFAHNVQFAGGGTQGTNKIYAFYISDTVQTSAANQPRINIYTKLVYRDM